MRMQYPLAVALLVLLAACAPTPVAQMRADAQSVHDETTKERLEARGAAFASIGDMTRAEQYFVAALKAGGDPKRLTERLLSACIADGRYPVALEYADDYLRNHPSDTDVRYAAASISAAMGENARAREGLEQVLTEKPDLADAHYALATVVHQDGDDPVRADLHYREYLRLDPKGPHAEAARSLLLKSVR